MRALLRRRFGLPIRDRQANSVIVAVQVPEGLEGRKNKVEAP